MTNNQNIDITIYVFIGLGVIGLIAAILWTKVIKKNDYVYANKSWLTLKHNNQQICDLLVTNNLHGYFMQRLFISDLSIKADCFFYLSAVLITNKVVYCLTYELNKRATQIKRVRDGLICVDHQQKQLHLPLEISSVLKNYGALKRIVRAPIKIIVPCAHKTWTTFVSPLNNGDVVFVKNNTVGQTILADVNEQNKQQAAELDVQAVRQRLAQRNYAQRFRWPFMRQNVKDTAWNKERSTLESK